MKVKIIETGELVEVHYWYQKSGTKEHIYRESSDLRGDRCWSENEIEFIKEQKFIDWEQRRFELVKAALPIAMTWVSEYTTKEDTALKAIAHADAVIAKLKEKNV